VMLVPIPLFFFSATQKIWTSVREEILALRQESEEESSSSGSDPEDFVAANDKITLQELQIPREAAASPDKTIGNQRELPAGALTSKRLLRHVSVPKFLRVEEDAQKKRDDQQRMRALQIESSGRRDDPFAQRHAAAMMGAPRGGLALDQPLLLPTMRKEGEPYVTQQRHTRSQRAAFSSASSEEYDEDTDSDESRGGDEIPALVPTSMMSVASRSRLLHMRRELSEEDVHEGSSDAELMPDDASNTADVASLRRTRWGVGGRVELDDTARRVFEQQLQHDEATRREHAFDDLMALEQERHGGGSTRDDLFAVL
jgi:hypothetical protein